MAIIAPQGHRGFATVTGPYSVKKNDTIQCGHCDYVVELKPGAGITIYLIFIGFDEMNQPVYKEEAGAFCRMCMRPVCLRCHDIGSCIPFEKKLALMEGHKD